ncbi:hypothetical protein HGRIS_001558 [Hohenbuehelia grisea]|uniref:Uncharacterized protein n=1 Tax=Hohenbuehelia grisea TaxID=104357 RepID=A0ABR3JPU5_9AGAR
MTVSARNQQVGAITLDNASNNNTFLENLEEILISKGIPFDRDGNRIRYFPHVVNLACQAIMTELKADPRAPALSPASADPAHLDECARYAAALAQDPVGKCRSTPS